MNRRRFLQSSGAAVGAHALGARFSDPRQTRLAVPNRQQLAWQDAELGLFVHFGVNTFSDREWGLGNEDPGSFDPARLDAAQWARAAKAGGFRYMVLTAKHHDGFCLWPSRLTTHSVASSPWRGGRGDVVREFSDAARAEGLRVGFYLSPWDRHAPSYGAGRAYDDFYIGQLTELLTQYGSIAEVWFDGANGEGPNGRRQAYDWERIHATVRRLQPDALMFSDAGPDIRWIGNERGLAGEPNWCPVQPALVPVPGLDGPGIIEALQHGNPDGTVWRPAEADVSIRPGWFWHRAEDEGVKSVDELLELYQASVGRGGNLLLNVPPTTDGLFHETDVRRLAGFGERVRNLFAEDLAAGATLHRTREGAELELRGPVTFDLVLLAEEIARGQTVARYRVEAWTNDAWTVLSRGATIGHKRIDRCAPVTAARVRVVVEDAVGPVRLALVGLFHSPA